MKINRRFSPKLTRWQMVQISKRKADQMVGMKLPSHPALEYADSFTYIVQRDSVQCKECNWMGKRKKAADYTMSHGPGCSVAGAALGLLIAKGFSDGQ